MALRTHRVGSWLLLASACAMQPDASRAPSSTAITPVSEVFSEPAEYAERPISAEAGAAYFGELGVGDPYGAGFAQPVLYALMDAYPDDLGRDFAGLADRFGLIRNREAPADPHAVPVGMHLTRDPITRVDFVVFNCAVCHADLVRAGGHEQLVMGMGSKRLRLHAYDAALVEIGLDPRLDEHDVLRRANAAAKTHDLPWPPDVRMPIVAETLKRLRGRARVRAEAAPRLAAALPGRVATIEGFMLALEEQYGTHLELPARTGWAKIPDIATWRYRETNSFDGASFGSPVAMIAEADFVFGVRPRWIDEHRHIATSMVLWLRGFSRTLEWPAPVDGQLVARGRERFDSSCASCHGMYPAAGRVAYVEQIVPASVVGTDDARRLAVTDELVAVADADRNLAGLVRTKRSDGYVPRPLVDVWARGLYGHAGQWPDLHVLATPPSERPTLFVVRLDAPLDLERIGSPWAPARRVGDRVQVREGEAWAEYTPGPDRYLYDASVPGLGVQGHPFLSDLPPDDRRAVLEFLKTL